jgi:hypothetical protein
MYQSRFILFALFTTISSLWSHDPMLHFSAPEEVSPAESDSSSPESGKKIIAPIEEKWWRASLSTGWQSRMIHYGVSETGSSGAYTTSLTALAKGFSINVWSGVGTGNDYLEWDFTGAYTLDLGPVFLIPGYNFRYQPGHVEGGHDHAEESHESGEHHEEDAEESSEGGHSDLVYNNEIFLIAGVSTIPYVTPSLGVISNLNNAPGVFLEFRLDGDVPLYKDIVSLQPYALLGVNLGYNSSDSLGWNNFQIGLEAKWKINRIIDIFAGVNYSVAMTALRDIEQGNEVWANVGVTFSY